MILVVGRGSDGAGCFENKLSRIKNDNQKSTEQEFGEIWNNEYGNVC